MIETTLIFAGGALLLVSIVLSFTIDRAIRRAGIQPSDENERSRGFRDVIERLRAWSESRQSR